MADNNQDRSQDQGQEGIDRETERRNRENETGQTEEGQQFTSEQRQQLGEQAEKRQPGEGGFVGSTQDKSSDYLTKGEQDQDFAPEGQGAQDTSAGSSDVETGQSQDRDSRLDDGSESDR
jgi:hypothetical protein